MEHNLKNVNHCVVYLKHVFYIKYTFCFIDFPKAFDCEDQNKLWKILKEMGIPDHLTSWEICMQVKSNS